MEKQNQKQSFEMFTRILLNNWHYIPHRVLPLHEGVNFFTGHSGSGKSTVLDALQILLYADTDGRGFFNKAAADDSDRHLIEYLRGMVNIGENREKQYIRNQNFSTTIAVELKRTDTEEYQCIGVVFDVETGTNEISRMFFWHKGELPSSMYRTNDRAMATNEVKTYLQANFSKEERNYGSSNVRFRSQLYDVYLGGLNPVRFPKLFKKAIPFKMDIKLEDFVKEYICMEEDIQIEEMQESVMQYGRMRKKIGDTCEEIRQLEEIEESYQKLESLLAKDKEYDYFIGSYDIHRMKDEIGLLQVKITKYQEDCKMQEEIKQSIEGEIDELDKKRLMLERKISASGIDEMKANLKSLGEMIERLQNNKAKWIRTAKQIESWKEEDITPNSIIWDIDRFTSFKIKKEELIRLKSGLQELKKDTEREKKELDGELKQYRTEREVLKKEYDKVKQGENVYSKELENARLHILKGLQRKTGKPVQVEILADLLEITDEKWRDAVEGYMNRNKLLIVVGPEYVRDAMALYEELDPEKYHRVSILDTEKVMKETHYVHDEGLARAVTSRKPYVQAYLDFLMGNVIKCQDIDELREQKIGITPDCKLYSGYRFQSINPNYYTKYAAIGAEGRRKKLLQLGREIKQLEAKIEPLMEEKRELSRIMEHEVLSYDIEDYLEWKQDIADLTGKEKEQSALEEKIRQVEQHDIQIWIQERTQLEDTLKEKKASRDKVLTEISVKNNVIRRGNEDILEMNEDLIARDFKQIDELEQSVTENIRQMMADRKRVDYEKLKAGVFWQKDHNVQRMEESRKELRTLRYQYNGEHPARGFAAEADDNEEYRTILNRLSCTDIQEYYEKANHQATEAINLFKQDFIYKIRYAIRGAMEQRDELNRIISKLDFGKDKYSFRVTKNKGADGKFYDMFMAEDLKIDPAELNNRMENQMNLFAMGHEEKYGELVNELINIFIPPDNATPAELEEAKQNMDKYADYRTYLSFDMEQTIHNGERPMVIHLNEMISKNSGGEGQNPLYVALLASFAQAYRINMPGSARRNPTIRLVVLDEAFSKMDAEKVGSCIKLIREFGFQAIISATNDKIQNYLESVDKTFVYANPNKKNITIKEFEKERYSELLIQEDSEE